MRHLAGIYYKDQQMENVIIFNENAQWIPLQRPFGITYLLF